MMRDPTVVLFFEKAERALDGAQVLLAAKHAEGACNRAYYAMFNAAHAALFALGIEEIKAPIKSHNGLVGKFGQHLVKGGYLAATHGEALNAVQLIRQVADYNGDPVAIEKATEAVEKAAAFVAAVQTKFIGGSTDT